MRKLSAGLLLLLGLASPALAQTKFTLPPPGGVFLGGYQVVTSCGAASGLVAGNLAFGAMDTTGAICTAASGGGGAVTIANGADVAEGSTTDAASTAGGAGTVSAKLRLMTTQLGTINTTLGTPFQAGASIANTTFGATQATAANLNATVVGTGTFAVQATTQGAVNITLTDCSGTIAAGAAAQNSFTAASTRHGFTIANIDTTEVLWMSFTTTAAASRTGSYPLSSATAVTLTGLSSFTSPPGMGINTALSVIAATTAHKFSCTVW